MFSRSFQGIASEKNLIILNAAETRLYYVPYNITGWQPFTNCGRERKVQRCTGKGLSDVGIGNPGHCSDIHDDVIKWKRFPRYWPFVRGIQPVPGDFPTQRPVTRTFNVFFDMRLNKRLSKQWWGWWIETPSRPLWRHCNDKVVSGTQSSFRYRNVTYASHGVLSNHR